jgi:hypothetical protein
MIEDKWCEEAEDYVSEAERRLANKLFSYMLLVDRYEKEIALYRTTSIILACTSLILSAYVAWSVS